MSIDLRPLMYIFALLLVAAFCIPYLIAGKPVIKTHKRIIPKIEVTIKEGVTDTLFIYESE